MIINTGGMMPNPYPHIEVVYLRRFADRNWESNRSLLMGYEQIVNEGDLELRPVIEPYFGECDNEDRICSNPMVWSDCAEQPPEDPNGYYLYSTREEKMLVWGEWMLITEFQESYDTHVIRHRKLHSGEKAT